MSKNYLTQKQALTKIGLSGGGSDFVTKSWLISNGNFDTNYLSPYQNGEFIPDDYINKKKAMKGIFIVQVVSLNGVMSDDVIDVGFFQCFS